MTYRVYFFFFVCVSPRLPITTASLPESGDENICGVCTLEIDGSRTQVFNSFYHPACVVCASCTRVITGAVKESFKDRKAYCAACYANLPKVILPRLVLVVVLLVLLLE